MLVLDDTYISPEVLEFAQASQEPIFDNASAQRYASQGVKLNIVDKSEAANGRIVAFSEAYLDEVKRYCNEETARAIALCKDKAESRRILAPMFPNYVFEEYSVAELFQVDPSTFTLPVVLKPSTGFFSLGIYPIFTVEDWHAACNDIKEHSSSWSEQYGSTVVNNTNFLVESYLDGEEYAIDAYFNEKGEAVILDILKHDFAGSEDVSDRLYYTSKAVVEQQMQPMQDFLTNSNRLLGFKNFPVHVEVRIGEDGVVNPIEFNPMRFAGLCTTDLSYFAYGYKTYEMFLRNEQPNWDEVLADKEDSHFNVVILSTDGTALPDDYSFDYEAVARKFSKVLGMREMDAKHYNTFGVLFTQVSEENAQAEADYILHSTLQEFIS